MNTTISTSSSVIQREHSSAFVKGTPGIMKVLLRSILPSLTEITLNLTTSYPVITAMHRMKTNQFARAYVKFKTSDGALRFARAFDGHLFKNADGDEHRAVVEMAPRT